MFISKIKIESVRNINDFDIPLSTDKRMNLVITGKNGSGKTTLLREIKKYLNNVSNGNLQAYDDQVRHLEGFKKEKERILADPKSTDQQKSRIEQNIQGQVNWLNQFGGPKISFENPFAIFNHYQKGIHCCIL